MNNNLKISGWNRHQTLLTLLLPPLVFLLLFFLLPLGIVVIYSFLQRGTYGGVTPNFTLDNYQRLFKAIYWSILLRSCWLALLTTIVCLIIGYPLAWLIATRTQAWRNFLLFMVIIPFWTNFLVRTYSWVFLLRGEGVINSILQSLHIIDQPLKMLNTPVAVIIGLVYDYLPFMILPLFAAIERFNFSLLEAAQDLGANDLATLLKVIIPLTSRGIMAGSLLVFIPVVGEFVIPDLLGGAKSLMIGNLIQNQFIAARDWPFGSALSVMMLMAIFVPMLIYLRIGESKETLK